MDHGLYGFESILKLISYRFGLGALNKRVARGSQHRAVASTGSSADFDVPDLPDPQHIASRPCSLGRRRPHGQPGAAHVSDLAALEGLAVRHGFRATTASRTSMFRKPDSVRKALAASG